MMAERPNLHLPSSAESDRYEELLGGLEFVLVRYSRFFQLVHRAPGGRVSISIEPDGGPAGARAASPPRARRVLAAAGLFPA